MKKQTKKLQLAKDTVLKLEVDDSKRVAGGISASWCYFCIPSHYNSCTCP